MIWGRCIKRMRIKEFVEEVPWSTSDVDGGSYHLTLLSCFSVIESKQTGHRAHLVVPEVFK